MATRQGVLYLARKRRRQLQDRTAYRFLVATPSDLGSAAAGGSLTGLQLPANSDLSLSIDAATSPGDITVTVGSRTIGIPGGASGTEFYIGWHERGETVVINRGASGPAGTVTLYTLDEWNRAAVIATGTFS